MSTLSDRIKERMAVMRLNNAQLAAACKVKPPTSFHWASGKTKHIKGEPLLRAARTLGVTPEWLATGMGTKFPENSHPGVGAKESTVSYLPDPKLDRMTQELLDLFGQLDVEGKREYLMHLRGFVAGRRPHQIGDAPAVAGK